MRRLVSLPWELSFIIYVTLSVIKSVLAIFENGEHLTCFAAIQFAIKLKIYK